LAVAGGPCGKTQSRWISGSWVSPGCPFLPSRTTHHDWRKSFFCSRPSKRVNQTGFALQTSRPDYKAACLWVVFRGLTTWSDAPEACAHPCVRHLPSTFVGTNRSIPRMARPGFLGTCEPIRHGGFQIDDALCKSPVAWIKSERGGHALTRNAWPPAYW